MPLDDQEINRLVDAARKGNQTAFGHLVREFQGPVFRLVRQIIGTGIEVEDVVSTTFIKAWRYLPEFRGEANFWTWIYRIALNESTSHLRKRSRDAKMFPDVESGNDDDDDRPLEDRFASGSGQLWDETLLQHVTHTHLQRAVEKLPEQWRLTVWMHYYDERSVEEIGTVLGVPVNTVKTYLFRARKTLRADLEREMA